jgi:hypothetical protein
VTPNSSYHEARLGFEVAPHIEARGEMFEIEECVHPSTEAGDGLLGISGHLTLFQMV